ncbi:MAG: mevalonate kinase [Chloroflexi bacterium]|nr:mevalonate kinase [Chloroflexota bacterium]
MPAIYATAPGKAILFGEHAVVYGYPAIAVPVLQVQAKVVALPNLSGPKGEITLDAPDIGLHADLEKLPGNHPLALAVHQTLATMGVERSPAVILRITSTIPVAAGLGSGAAVSVALIRALSSFLGKPLNDSQVCAAAFEVEKTYHGNPSGIDNTVVTYAQPVYFVRGQPPCPMRVARPFTLIIGDTGVPSPTVAAVTDVRDRWLAERERYEALFSEIGKLANRARPTIEEGQLEELGALMDENQAKLEQLGVSSPELDRLIQAARQGGAQGAKLSGAGIGGNMIALAPAEKSAQVEAALQMAGAVRTIVSVVHSVEKHEPD